MLAIYTLFALRYRKRNLVLLFLMLQIASLISVIIVRLNDYSNDDKTLINVIFMMMITLPIIIPYKNYSDIIEIKKIPIRKFNKLSNILFIIGGFSFIFLLATAIVVNMLVSDINAFRYEEGASVDFYYKMLPFDVKFFILAYTLYYFSYFFIPLHFYCQYIGDKKRSIIYLILSLNLILYGMTFFSRWAIVLFVLLYIAHWICYSKLIPEKVRQIELKWLRIIGGSLGCIFLFITITRFEDANKAYEREEMNQESIIKNTSLYSMFDYLGKSNSRSIYALDYNYKDQTFGGRYLWSETQNFFSVFRIGSPSEVSEHIDKIWTEYHGTFRTYACYLIFDVGYFLAIIISIIIVLVLRRRGKIISFDKYIVSSLFMMVPICSIFFSYLNVFLFCLILFGFIKLYLKIA